MIENLPGNAGKMGMDDIGIAADVSAKGNALRHLIRPSRRSSAHEADGWSWGVRWQPQRDISVISAGSLSWFACGFRTRFLSGSERNRLLTRRGVLTRESENLGCHSGGKVPVDVFLGCLDAERENSRFWKAST